MRSINISQHFLHSLIDPLNDSLTNSLTTPSLTPSLPHSAARWLNYFALISRHCGIHRTSEHLFFSSCRPIHANKDAIRFFSIDEANEIVYFLDALYLYKSPYPSLNHLLTDSLTFPARSHVITIRKHWTSLYSPLRFYHSSSAMPYNSYPLLCSPPDIPSTKPLISYRSPSTC